MPTQGITYDKQLKRLKKKKKRDSYYKNTLAETVKTSRELNWAKEGVLRKKKKLETILSRNVDAA